MAIPPAYHADSDADDEYERSVLASPVLPDDDDTSVTDSDPPSTEPTPTTFGHNVELGKPSPGSTIAGWTASQVADFINNMGLPQYCDKFLENEIVGEALIALRHEELKEMGIVSIGHRITILKAVYDVKIKQEVTIDSDHWIPPSAEAEAQDKTATKDDFSRIIKSLEIRDHRIMAAEADLRKLTEDYRKLRDELLPLFRIHKETQPLPYHPNSHSPNHHDDGMSPMTTSQLPQEKIGSSLSRKFSTKRLFIGSTPKSSSPTQVPQSIPEGRSVADTNIDPSAAAVAATSHLNATVSGGSQPSTSPSQANMPSPTSPNTYANQPALRSRTFGDQSTPNATRHIYSHDDPQSYGSTTTFVTDPRNPTPTPGARSRVNTYERERDRQPQQQISNQQDDPPPSGGSGTSSGPSLKPEPSVEIFKSFRVSMEDPCEKVLPAALKKYNINADWKNYALYIVYGDQERCLGLREKPLILFKQLDKEGRKPMFMLRRHAAPIEGHSGPTGSSHAGGIVGNYSDGGSSGLGSSRGHQSSITLPGGVL